MDPPDWRFMCIFLAQGGWWKCAKPAWVPLVPVPQGQPVDMHAVPIMPHSHPMSAWGMF